MTAVVAALPLLADPEDAGKAGPLGLLVIIALVVACYFLFRSMSRHLRKVREEYPVGGDHADSTSISTPTRAASTADPSVNAPSANAPSANVPPVEDGTPPGN